MNYASMSGWNALPPSPEEYSALLKAKSQTDAHFNRGVIKSGWHDFGGGRMAWVKRCNIFGYCAGVGGTNEFSGGVHAAAKWWIGFPNQKGEVRKEKESVIFRKVRRYFYERGPDEHHWR
jgi:hypothetical protein